MPPARRLRSGVLLVFIDFVLLWSAVISVLKLALKEYISTETGALLLIGVLLFVVITRLMGSNIFRERSRVPKFFLSLALFALSVADGDVRLAIQVAIWTMALPICLFGMYICFRSAFGRM
jgi:hypothetical protein